MYAGVAFGISAFTSLLAIVDPFAAVPVYIGLTSREPPEVRKRIALRATLTCVAVLTAFAAGGSLVFRWFGITMPAFRIAGGILLFTVALEMMRASPSKTKTSPEEEVEGAVREDVGVMPVGIPLLSGPGAIASATVLAQRARTVPEHVALVAAIVTAGAITWLTLRSAESVAKMLGRTGMNLITRIMGLLLAATAVQFVVDGVVEAFHLGG